MSITGASLEEITECAALAQKTGNLLLITKLQIAAGNLEGAKTAIVKACESTEGLQDYFIELLRSKKVLTEEETRAAVGSLGNSAANALNTYGTTDDLRQKALGLLEESAFGGMIDSDVQLKILQKMLSHHLDMTDYSFFIWGPKFTQAKEFAKYGLGKFPQMVEAIRLAVAENFARTSYHYGVKSAMHISRDEFFGSYFDRKEIHDALVERTADSILTQDVIGSCDYYIRHAKKAGIDIRREEILEAKLAKDAQNLNVIAYWLSPPLWGSLPEAKIVTAVKSFAEKFLQDNKADLILRYWLNEPLRKYFLEAAGEKAKPYLLMEKTLKAN